MTDLWLREGHVVGLDLPLGEVIETRWRNGELQRVHEDGSPWQDEDGDEFAILALPGATAPPLSPAEGSQDDPPPPGGPEKPAGNASRKTWADYAIALGACTPAEAGQLSRAELIDAVTAPEDKPPALPSA